MLNPSDFASVQWGRKMSTIAQHFAGVSPADLRKFSSFLIQLANLRENAGQLSEQQVVIIMQNLRSKTLTRLEVAKGGIRVEFTGGGYEYERFLIRQDGRMPNGRYEAKKVD